VQGPLGHGRVPERRNREHREPVRIDRELKRCVTLTLTYTCSVPVINDLDDAFDASQVQAELAFLFHPVVTAQ